MVRSVCSHAASNSRKIALGSKPNFGPAAKFVIPALVYSSPSNPGIRPTTAGKFGRFAARAAPDGGLRVRSVIISQMRKKIGSSTRCLVAGFVFLFPPSHADESIVADYDLRDQLTLQSKHQAYGSCHVNAAVDLFEAACYRLTGEHVKLMEPMYFGLHVRNVLRRREAGLGERAEDDPYLLGSDGDGGSPTRDLDLIYYWNCEASEPESIERLNRELKKMIESGRDFQEKGLHEKNSRGLRLNVDGFFGGFLGGAMYETLYFAFHKEIMSSLRTRVGKFGCGAGLRLLHLIAPGTGYTLASIASKPGRVANEAIDLTSQELEDWLAKNLTSLRKDPRIGRCLANKYQTSHGPATFEQMRSYLAQGIPFLCEGKYKSSTHSIYRTGANHVAIVVGSGHSAETGKPYLLVRNTWGQPPEYWDLPEGGCSAVTVFR